MRKRHAVIAATVALPLAGCGGASAPEPVDAAPAGSVGAPESTVRVSMEEIIDVDETLPANVGGIDLGDVAPAPDLTFCEAFAAAPARWVDDAVVPVQFWVDVFTASRADAPTDAVTAVDRLLAYGQWKLDWNFKRVEERPEFTSADAAAAVEIADVAAATCDDLPLVVGLDGRSSEPFGWDDLTDEQIETRCADEVATVQAGIDWYRGAFDAAPLHQQQIETAANEATYLELETTGSFPEFFYVASDLVGVGADGSPEPVAGRGCDR